jgi:hypothetical protein
MADRLILDTKLREILCNSNIYYNPPASVQMKYDAIRYSRKRIENVFADNSVYLQNDCYEVIAIYRDPDSDLPRKISMLPMCSHDRQYIADNLYHDVFTIYNV